ncbi:hypothetical protein CPB84DRAFT_1750398 [Gymnopilus junonius]|uniref:Uncharacterized protein n=1 Tax=Gymnopilus junonius TaxID=109634 RepID=A0A9P5NHW5_GYMJU|nr:hypothetical protein CPB84DRAFT_1750398 [Gymnopilus junonius]
MVQESISISLNPKIFTLRSGYEPKENKTRTRHVVAACLLPFLVHSKVEANILRNPEGELGRTNYANEIKCLGGYPGIHMPQWWYFLMNKDNRDILNMERSPNESSAHFHIPSNLKVLLRLLAKPEPFKQLVGERPLLKFSQLAINYSMLEPAA